MKRICLSLIISGVVCAVSFALPTTITDLVVFGDAYSDQGNYVPEHAKLCSDEAAPQTNKDDGDYAHKLWSEYLADKFNVSVASSTLGGNNYARADALTDDLEGQVQQYLARHGQQADPDALYVVWAGTRDFFYKIVHKHDDPPQVLIDGVEESLEAVSALASHGARHIVLVGLPDLSVLPLVGFGGDDARAKAHQFSEAWNVLSKRSVGYLKNSFPNAQLYYWDPVPFFSKIGDSPSSYGFPDKIGSFDNKGSFWCRRRQTKSPDIYLFFNSMLPTSHFHWVIAEELFRDAKVV